MSTTAVSNSKLNRGYSMALVSAAILSTTAILIRYLTQTYHIPALVLAFWRDSFVALTLFPILGLLRLPLLRVDRLNITFLIAYGLVLAVFNSLWTLSVAWNGAARSTVMVYCSAGFTVLLGRLCLNERLDWVKLAAAALSLIGCGLVAEALGSLAWRGNLIGILTGISSGLFYAIYSLMGRSASNRGLNPWTTLSYTFGFAAVFLLCLNLLLAKHLPGTATHLKDFLWLRTSFVGWGILFLLAAGPTITGFGLYNVSLSYLPASVTNLILTLEPVFTAMIAFFLLGERLKESQLIGSIMILACVFFLRIHEGRIAIRVYPESDEESRGAVSVSKGDS